MSTIYNWNEELVADTTGAGSNWVLVYDTSTGATKKARASSLLAAGNIGFYGATAVNQGTMTQTAVTALATATVSAANAAGVFCWSSSTVAKSYVARLSQIQVDLKTLMARVNSTGLVSIAGV